jgi:4-alpha-glucanotransferase
MKKDTRAVYGRAVPTHVTLDGHAAGRSTVHTVAMTQRDQWGVAEGWWGTDGAWHGTDTSTRAALHFAQGLDDHPDGPPESSPTWFVHPGEQHALWSPATVALEDGGELPAEDRLPSELPLGAHLLHPLDGGPVTRLFVVPQRAPRPRRGWGWSAQLYATRSEQSWGHGDLADLADLARWAHDGGAELLAHNPLGASLPLPTQQPSPYYASSRRFWSPLYLRVEAVMGAELAGAEVSSAAAAGVALNGPGRLDRDEVWRLKLGALEAIWQQVRHERGVVDALAIAADDEALTRHATFCALSEHHGSGWSDWPAEHRHPATASVEGFRATYEDRVSFWRWLHLEAEVQLATAAASGAALMADLPVGFDPSGSDAWADQDLLALGCSVGAPPDDFSPTGQDWGLPPYVPWKLRDAGYAPWIDTLRRVLRHSGALRIDHVMGLFRLFWIPPGLDATHGGYVYQYGTELLDLAVLEAARAGASLVGEDLGTVEDDVRRALGERDVFGYRIAWFQDDDPTDWPATTLASLTTHDLPTVAGLWSGADARQRELAGLAPDPDGDALLRARLARLVGIDPQLDGDRRPGGTADETGDLVVAAHEALAASGSDLAVATLEDAAGQLERPNLPGTVDEHPNWRTPLPVSIETLDDTLAQRIAAAMRARRGAPRHTG